VARTATKQRAGIALRSSVQVDAQRLERMWRLTPDERDAAARRGEFSLGELLTWAARHPSEVELVDGEFWFLAAHLADYDPD